MEVVMAEIQAAFFVFVVGVVVSLVFVAWPFSRALGLALASARDPSHRLTLLSPWYFFRRTLLKRIWKWGMIWIGLLIWSLGQTLHTAWGHGAPALWWAYQAIENGIWPFYFWFIIFAAGLTCCPYIANEWLRLAVVSAISVGLLLLLERMTRWLPGDWSYIYVRFDDPKNGPHRGLYDFNLYHLWMSLGSALILLGTLIRSRKMGDRWFRFEV